MTAVDALPGTDGYRPPEYSDRKFSVLSDVYSETTAIDKPQESFAAPFSDMEVVKACLQAIPKRTKTQLTASEYGKNGPREG